MGKPLKLGLFGLGCVGQGFYELLQQSGSDFSIEKIVVKNTDRARKLENITASTNHADILDNPDIDLVVELIDDADVAFKILKGSLQKRKPVITANKKMLAENLEEIYRLQHLYNTPVLYEGSVCGSIPVIRNLETHFSCDELKKIEGIFNGSTNYILTKMIDEKKDYLDALQEAQQLGFAESDPTLDVKGFDPKYKLAIAIAHAFGIFVHPDQLVNLGIDRITPGNILHARRNNCTIKLVARAELVDNQVIGFVAPQLIPLEHPLANIKNEFNAITVFGNSTGLQTMTGKGAGSLPTGLVVLSDVFAVASGSSYGYKKIGGSNPREFNGDVQVKVHVSLSSGSLIGHDDFDEFVGGYQSNHFRSLEGWVSLQKAKRWSELEGVSVILNRGDNLRRVPKKRMAALSVA